jgi:hypothetical protein
LLLAVTIGSAAFVVPPSAGAATFSCAASTPAQAVFRADGITELAPDVVITCTGGTPTTVGANLPTANLTFFLNSAVTSRLLPSGSTTQTSEAELIIDDPSPASQLLCATVTTGCTVSGKGGPASYDGSLGHPNVFGGIVDGASVTFFGVPIDQPGTPLLGRDTLTLRLVNLRVNAEGPAGQPIVASLSVSSATPNVLPISNSTLTLGKTAQALSTSLRSPDGAAAVTSGPSVQACGTSTEAATMRLAELSETAFRTRTIAGAGPFDQDVPGTAYGSESGFSNSAFAAPFTTAGLADSGTRLQLSFTGPDGATIMLPTGVPFNETAGSLRMIQKPVGPFAATPGSSAQLTLAGGTATAAYEVIAADPNQLESATIPIALRAPAGTPAGAVTASASLAPQSSLSSDPASAPIPRFSDKPAPSTIATIVPCPPGGGGSGGGGGVVGEPGVRIASVRALALTHKRFAIARGTTAVIAKKKKRAPRGTAFVYTLSGGATVHIVISRIAVVRRTRTTRCLGHPRRAATHCRTAQNQITLTRRDAAGLNRTPFTGRTHARALRPGSYEASVTATNAAGTSKPRVVAFTVLVG